MSSVQRKTVPTHALSRQLGRQAVTTEYIPDTPPAVTIGHASTRIVARRGANHFEAISRRSDAAINVEMRLYPPSQTQARRAAQSFATRFTSYIGYETTPLRPEGGALVEVTCRTLQGRLLLRPSTALNEILVGVLGRAQRLYPVRICAFVFLSTHYHLLLDVEDARTLSLFMGYLNSNLAREVGRLVHWKEKVWGRRYQSIPVSSEEAAQIDRLRYVLSHGCKEGLVANPSEWPGLHCVGALVNGETVEGYWFDRTQEYAARRRGENFDRLAHATRETVILSPLPCWEHLSPEIQKQRVTKLVAAIEAEAADRRTRTGSQPLGASAVRGQHPHDRPQRLKRSPAPLFHTFRKTVHRELYEAYAWFVATYREASTRLRAGDRSALFPAGSFPPALPFVGG
jgi:REP element-mobilizing transposase RayT